MKITAALVMIIFLSGFFMAGQGDTGSGNIKIYPSRLFEDIRFSSIDKVIKYGENYYILEAINHRIVILDQSLKKIGQISEIGQEQGEIFHPGNFTIKNGRIYIVDGNDRGISRFQWFDLGGKYLDEFTIGKSYGMAVASNGDIYVGQPEKGKLISVYSPGGKFVRAFGKLHGLSDFYGAFLDYMDKEFMLAINRVNLCMDGHDNLYVSFVGAPFFQKYSSDGALIFQSRIKGPEADQIVAGFAKKLRSPVRRSIDNIPTPLITTGISVDNKTGNIVISFQWKRAWIYLADANGEKIATLEPGDSHLLFHNIFLSSDSVLILPRLSVVKFNEAFYLKLNAQKTNQKKEGI